MPTYTVHATAGTLSGEQVERLAREVARVHSDVTGAPRSFVQCLISWLPDGGRFIGGRRADPRGVYVHGLIRAGRDAGVRTRLVHGLRDAVVLLTGVPAHLVWVYLSQLPHTDMAEFGEVLPEPGREEEWVAGLPAEVRSYLDSLGR